MEVKELKTLVKLVKGKKPKSLSETKTKTHSAPYLLAKVIRGSEKPKFGKEDEMVVVSSADLVIISDGDAGEVFQGLSGGLASTMSKIELLENINLKYLKYFLISNRKLFSDTRTGAAIPHLNKDVFFNLQIPVPSLQEQEKIVERLDKVFGEVGNMLKNLKNKNAQSLDLYESILKNTFLNINSDYEPIENFCNEIFAGGDRPKEFSKTPDETFKYKIFSNGITNNGLYGFSSEYRIKDPALTISARGTIGHLEIRKEPFTPIIRLITIVPKDFLHLDFLYHFLKYSLNLKTGSVIPQLTVPMIKNIQIPKLSMHNQKKISELLDSVLLKSIDLRMIIDKQENLFDDFKKSILNKEFSYE